MGSRGRRQAAPTRRLDRDVECSSMCAVAHASGPASLRGRRVLRRLAAWRPRRWLQRVVLASNVLWRRSAQRVLWRSVRRTGGPRHGPNVRDAVFRKLRDHAPATAAATNPNSPVAALAAAGATAQAAATLAAASAAAHAAAAHAAAAHAAAAHATAVPTLATPDPFSTSASTATATPQSTATTIAAATAAATAHAAAVASAVAAFGR